MVQRIICLLAGFLLAAVLAEMTLHVLPYSTGYGAQAIDAEHPIVLGAPHRHYTYSRDWSFHFANSGVLNNEGFRATYDYVPDPNAIAVIGNSFVQADALTPDLRMTERLGSLLQRKTYAVGIDGFSLADYLVASQWAVAHGHTRTVLVLLTTEELILSCVPRGGQHYLRFVAGTVSMSVVERSNPSLLKRALNSSSLFRYLFDNLHAPENWVRGWRHEVHGSPTATPLVPKAAPQPVSRETPAASATRSQTGCGSPQFNEAATRYLLDAFRQLESASGARVIFALAPDYYQRHTVIGAFRDVDGFAAAAESQRFEVVRLAQPFSAAAANGTPLTLMPIDRHWNAAANEVAARALADFVRSQPQAVMR
jgi:hypothetical protein